jgi:hypothetical protein
VAALLAGALAAAIVLSAGAPALAAFQVAAVVYGTAVATAARHSEQSAGAVLVTSLQLLLISAAVAAAAAVLTASVPVLRNRRGVTA